MAEHLVLTLLKFLVVRVAQFFLKLSGPLVHDWNCHPLTLLFKMKLLLDNALNLGNAVIKLLILPDRPPMFVNGAFHFPLLLNFGIN